MKSSREATSLYRQGKYEQATVVTKRALELAEAEVGPRHPDVAALRDVKHEDPLETRAREKRLSYVHLTGKIGCIVNGAGLAMATMDVVKHYGADPANYLDIGGGAKEEQVSEAIRIITADKAVNTIFFNIFA